MLIGACLSLLMAVVPAADDPYLDVMEAAVSAYSDEHIAKYVREVEAGGVREHGFPRLTANLGVLLSEGRQMGRKDIFRRMMDISCREAAKGKMKGWGGGNDFSVKELAICLVALEKAGAFPAVVTEGWRAALKSVRAANCYTVQPEVGAKRAYNWCVFGAASEQARLAAGLGGDRAFVERYVSDQLRWFDENGMYRDPDQPVVYDLVTRLQFAAILHYGYDGASRAKLEGLMDRSADATLAMLSACGEIPYGGRSNGFLHNNTFYSALCEWYAARCAKRGDADRAARFRAAARRSLAALEEWLAVRPVRHVKNLYPRETGYGCEDYAYFDKYMVTMGSWAMMAREFARDVASGDASAGERSPSYFVTSKDFHLVLMNAGDYTAELDYNADPHYDSDGLGRLCRAGAPAAICLSAPCAKKPFYALERANEVPLALLPVTEAKLEFVRCETEGGEVRSNWRMGGQKWTVGLSAAGLRSTLEGPGEVALALPAFDFDGETRTDITCDSRELTIAYKGWVCRYVANGGVISESGVTCCNRNGRYRRFVVRGNGRLEVTVAIERARADDREEKQEGK